VPNRASEPAFDDESDSRFNAAALRGYSAAVLRSASGEPAGVIRAAPRSVGQRESVRASRAAWNADADSYQAEHGGFLGTAEFVWCPDGLTEGQAGLLGRVRGTRILELGCGAASCARWLRAQGADVVGLDLSERMLAHAHSGCAATGIVLPLVQADASALPLRSGSFDTACSAFGAIPFVADLAGVLGEVWRVLRAGGRWVFAVPHPMRWPFPDVGGEAGLAATGCYLDRTPYVEADDSGRVNYVEHHRTVGDFVRAIRAAGLELVDLVEPEWAAGPEHEWGQWTALRGAHFPGTAIFCCRRPDERA
jgi:SAM-dependent methyltransferase